MANVITLAMLIEKKACEGQVKLFKKYFGNLLEITEEVCFKYYDEFDIVWLVDNILNDEQKKVYLTIKESAWKAYLAIQGPVWEAYLAIQGPGWEAYKKEQARAFYIAYNS